jgi:hypothetical protein
MTLNLTKPGFHTYIEKLELTKIQLKYYWFYFLFWCLFYWKIVNEAKNMTNNKLLWAHSHSHGVLQTSKTKNHENHVQLKRTNNHITSTQILQINNQTKKSYDLHWIYLHLQPLKMWRTFSLLTISLLTASVVSFTLYAEYPQFREYTLTFSKAYSP